jgi:phytoene synthase
MSIRESHKKKATVTEQIGRSVEMVRLTQQLPGTGDTDEQLLSTHGRTFHFAVRFLSPKFRYPIRTLYAFFRTLDDLVDQSVDSQQCEAIRAELDIWKKWFSEGYSFPAPQEPLGTRLAAVLAEHPIPSEIFFEFLDGMHSDLEPLKIHDFSEMHRYCSRVAGTVGRAITYIFGIDSAQALTAAENLGIGMQLTNILRDVGSDLAVGRIYLPLEDLVNFGCSPAHLLHLYREQRGIDERFRALMRYQVARAHHYYKQGLAGIWLLPADCRLAILTAGRLYRQILVSIQHQDYDVLHSRAATSFPEKVREAAISFALDRLWRCGEGYFCSRSGGIA